MTCAICNHSPERHLVIAEGNRFTRAETICLTGFCRCGHKPLKKKRYIGMSKHKVYGPKTKKEEAL